MEANALKTGARLNVKKLKELQEQHGLRFDTALADKLNVARSTLWRVRLPARDPRYNAPGKDFIAKALRAFPEVTFEELFFLDECCEVEEQKGIVQP